jgi:hypothetical protein
MAIYLVSTFITGTVHDASRHGYDSFQRAFDCSVASNIPQNGKQRVIP